MEGLCASVLASGLVAEGRPAGGGWGPRSWPPGPSPAQPAPKPAGQTCVATSSSHPPGRQAWLVATAAVSLVPSARSHRGHRALGPAGHAHAHKLIHAHGRTRSHMAGMTRPGNPLDWSVLMLPGGGEGGGQGLTEEAQRNLALPWWWVTTGATGAGPRSHRPRRPGRRGDPAVLHQSHVPPPAHPQLSTHPS